MDGGSLIPGSRPGVVAGKIKPLGPICWMSITAIYRAYLLRWFAPVRGGFVLQLHDQHSGGHQPKKEGIHRQRKIIYRLPVSPNHLGRRGTTADIGDNILLSVMFLVCSLTAVEV